MTKDACRIWGTRADLHHIFGRHMDKMDSPRAGGLYLISGEARDDYFKDAGRLDQNTKACLTTWLVDQRRVGIECPEIIKKTIEEAKHRRPLTVQQRADRLLGFLKTKQNYIGDIMRIEITNAAEKLYGPGHTEFGATLLAHTEAVRAEEVIYLIEQMEKRGFLERRGASEFVMTVNGYTYLSDLETKAVDSRQAFVAMWFDESMRAAYENGIEPAIREAGYEPLRIDRKEHINRIDDEIIAEIRRSRFLVAEFTQGESGARGGVYYEAGFAHGLNIPVIFICRE